METRDEEQSDHGHPLENFLARAAWLLADIRAHLLTLPHWHAEALCERIDDYFSETYYWLKSNQGGGRPVGSSSVPAAPEPGLGWKQAEPTQSSPANVQTTETDTIPEVPSSIPSSGGRGKPKTPWTDFF